MPITVLPIQIEYNGKRLKGDCTVVELPGCTELPYKFPLYRVALNKHKIKPDIFLFYKTDSKNKPFFWYKNSEHGSSPLWDIIAVELAKHAELSYRIPTFASLASL